MTFEEEDNVILIPMAVPTEVFATLNRVAVKQGRTAESLFTEVFRRAFEEIASSEDSEGE
jgi:hypothetical protein